MGAIVELDRYRRRYRSQKANLQVTADMASEMCESAFLASDWETFERYFRILKALQPTKSRRSPPTPLHA